MSELERSVEARLRRRVFGSASEADLFARVRAWREGKRYVVRMTLLDRDQHPLGERRLETRARHCSALDDSLVLVLSLAADVRRSATPPVAPTDAAQLTAPVRLERELLTPIEIPESATQERGGFAFQPSLGPSLGFGLLPQAALGIQARLEVRPPRFWPLVLDATFWGGQRLGTERGVRFALQTLHVGICPWRHAFNQLELSFCVDEFFGMKRAAGFGFDQDQPSMQGWAALGGGASVRYPIGSAFVGVSGSLLAPLVRRSYFYAAGDAVTLYREPWLLGVTAISVGLDL